MCWLELRIFFMAISFVCAAGVETRSVLILSQPRLPFRQAHVVREAGIEPATFCL